ncbi:MAG: M24 family metallopeptidase [Candidatus Limnocylindrales bacterium]
MIKDADEIALLTRAAHAADRVVAQIAAGRLIGRTEADVAREVRERLVAEGHEAAHFAIVGSGPNSASPHHEASERVIQAGEPIVLDIGGTLGGYGSDITRTLWVTGGDPDKGPDERFRHLYARASERPGGSHPRRPAGDRLRGGGRRRPATHRRRGLWRAVLPPDRPRDRP